MIHIRKATVWKALGGLGLLAAVMAAALLLIPAAGAQYEPCGDGTCDPTSENSDLCVIDCPCNDNGVADPGEGCGCRDVVCEGEKLRTACGTPCDVTGECPEGLSCFRGVCWEDCVCENRCGPAPACLANGASCTSDEECCSNVCREGQFCSSCSDALRPCGRDEECCPGLYCDDGECLPAG